MHMKVWEALFLLYTSIPNWRKWEKISLLVLFFFLWWGHPASTGHSWSPCEPFCANWLRPIRSHLIDLGLGLPLKHMLCARQIGLTRQGSVRKEETEKCADSSHLTGESIRPVYPLGSLCAALSFTSALHDTQCLQALTSPGALGQSTWAVFSLEGLAGVTSSSLKKQLPPLLLLCIL